MVISEVSTSWLGWGGVSASVSEGCLTLGPGDCLPLGWGCLADIPLGQSPPGQTPSGQTFPLGTHPLGRCPTWVDTPLGRHPPAQTPPAPLHAGMHTSPCPSMQGYTPPMNRIKDRCKNITYPPLRLRPVKIKLRLTFRGPSVQVPDY